MEIKTEEEYHEYSRTRYQTRSTARYERIERFLESRDVEGGRSTSLKSAFGGDAYQ
jgi:hypothetical protein